MAITDLELRMTIKTLAAKGLPKRGIARQLDLSEGTVRYHLRRMAAGAADGRGLQQRRALPCHDAIAVWMEHHPACNLVELHAWLATEHGYAGSVRSVQRYVADAWPPPPRRARRRVETPPGAQAQVDWGMFPDMQVGGERLTLHALEMALSHSRKYAVVWMPSQDTLSWLAGHNGCFQRLGGIPAVVRVDNTKTAVVRGAGAWGQLNESYRRYATTVRFHVDPCAPYSPQHKGKVERAVRTHRGLDLDHRAWESIEALQAATDAALTAQSHRRRCPATGTSVHDAWQAELTALAPLPVLPAPFDHVASRQVGTDALVSFEGRQYSVPFAYLGRQVEIRGGAGVVQVFAEQRVVAQHPRNTERRLLIDPAHYEGQDTPTVRAPMPLGKLGRRLQEIAAMAVERRPLDLYAALAEVAR